MTTFTVHTIETAPAGSRETLAHVRDTLGMIPNLAAAMAESPTLLRSFFTVRDIYANGTLNAVDIQVLSLTNAFENGCAWCMAFHSAAALRAGLPADELTRLRAGDAPSESRLKALSDFSRALVRNRGDVSAEERAAFTDAGFTNAHALEVVLGVAFSVMANYAGHLTHAPLGFPFEAHAWVKPEPA